MVAMDARRALIHGFAWGALAGLVLVALMYLANLLLGLTPLTQALSGPLLSIMPGFVFGFLIDNLQHAGKVVEEFGLIVGMVVGLGVLGAAWAWTARRWWRYEYSALVFAGGGWLVVLVLLLPVSGEGLLGLDTGITTPLIWAALFAAWGIVVQLGGRPDADPADPDRRRLLSSLPLTVGAISLGILALDRVPGWFQAIVDPPEAGLNGRSPELTPIDNFYVVSKNFGDPNLDGGSWRLKVGGMVDNPITLTLQDLHALPVTTEYVTLECISNLVGGPQISTGIFSGVQLKYLIQQASPQAGGTWAAFKSSDGYTESLPLSMINGDPTILVAYQLDGVSLPVEHGFPARILVPGHYGMKGPKWLTEINLVDHESGGYWEQQGWDHNAVVRTMSRIDVPQDGDILKGATVDVGGIAFAGTRGISKVEVSTDGGRTWTETLLTAPLSPLTWVLWDVKWTPPGEGSYQLVVRATDGTGALQDSSQADSYPSGSRGYHAVRVDVSK